MKLSILETFSMLKTLKKNLQKQDFSKLSSLASKLFLSTSFMFIWYQMNLSNPKSETKQYIPPPNKPWPKFREK